LAVVDCVLGLYIAVVVFGGLGARRALVVTHDQVYLLKVSGPGYDVHQFVKFVAVVVPHPIYLELGRET